MSSLGEVMVAMAVEKSVTRRSRWSRVRPWIQAAMLAVWLLPLKLHGVCSPVFHCYSCPLATFACPIGVIANFSALHVFPWVAAGTVLAAGAMLGTFVCGWVCPFGFLQDLLARIPTPKFTPPAWTSYGRYAVLVGLVIVVPFHWGVKSELFFCKLCPAGALEAAVPFTVTSVWNATRETEGKEKGEQKDAKANMIDNGDGQAQKIAWPGPVKIGVLIAFLVAAALSHRTWCRLFCPLGAVFGVMNYVSFLSVRFHPRRCIDCASCRSVCFDGREARGQVDGLSCVRCLDCTQCRAVTVTTVFSRLDRADGGGPTQAEPTAVHNLNPGEPGL